MSLTVAPLQEAVDRMQGRTPVARALSSQEWSDVPQELRDRAFFTANFAQADLLQLMHQKITRALELGREQVARGDRLVTRSTFIGDMKKALSDAGYLPPVGKEGSIQDHSSRGRLGLIYDINVRMAQEYAGWKVGQDPDILDAFPAQELIRWHSRRVPRNWISRWRSHGGKFFKGGRMIARKNDPIWVTISAFHNPYPPFDFNSGMGVRDVARDQAEALGVIEPGEKIQPAHKGFNDTLSLSCTNLTTELKERLQSQFGDQVVIDHNKAKWQAALISDLFDRATQPGLDPNRKGKQEVTLGVATQKTVALAKEAGMDLEGVEMFLREDDITKTWGDHGTDLEKRGDQRRLTKEDYLALPNLWRNPDQVGVGKKSRRLVFEKEMSGTQIGVIWQQFPEQKKVFLVTLYAKKKPGVDNDLRPSPDTSETNPPAVSTVTPAREEIKP